MLNIKWQIFKKLYGKDGGIFLWSADKVAES